MRRRHFFGILAATAAPAAKSLQAAENTANNSEHAPPDDEITRVCDLIARHLDREKAGDDVYEVLIAILRKQSRPFPVPDWLEEDEFWKYAQQVEGKQLKRRAGIGEL